MVKMASISLESDNTQVMTPKERATQAREIFSLMRSEYEKSKQCCVFKRYKELQRIVDMFTSEPVLKKLQHLARSGIEIEPWHGNNSAPVTPTTTTDADANLTSPGRDRKKHDSVELLTSGKAFVSANRLRSCRYESRFDQLTPTTNTPDSAFSSRPEGLNSAGTSSLNTPSSPRRFVFPVIQICDLALSPRIWKRQSHFEPRRDTVSMLCSPRFSKRNTVSKQSDQKPFASSSKSLQGFPRPIIRNDRIPEFHIPSRKSTRPLLCHTGLSSSTSECTFGNLDRPLRRPNGSSPSILRCDIETSSQVSLSQTTRYFRNCASESLRSSRGGRKGRKHRNGSLSLDLGQPKLCKEADFFDRKDPRKLSHSSFASEMEEATIKMALANIRKLKEECEALKNKSVFRKYICIKRLLKNCIYAFI